MLVYKLQNYMVQQPKRPSSNEVSVFNPLSPELNPIFYLLALLAHDFLHVNRIRVKSLTLRLLMSYIYIYIYGAPILACGRSLTEIVGSNPIGGMDICLL
jgi:hypothetical protein